MSDLKRTSWHSARNETHDGTICESSDKFTVIDCDLCHFKHIVPLPTPEELSAAYSHEYYSTEKPLYIERYLEDKTWWDSVYVDRYEYLESHLGPNRRRILDVGSGPGLFLAKGRERGWLTKGIEPSRQAAAYSRESLGLEIVEAFLDEELTNHLGHFDAINMGEVLEHVPDPSVMLRLAHRLLDDKGVICVIVPNDFNPFQMALRDHCGLKPWWIAPPHHLNYFDAASLARLLEHCGYKVINEETSFPIDLFLMMGKNYIGNDALGRECHTMRMTLEATLRKSGNADLMRKMYHGFKELGLGRELVFFAEKA